jgi:hypothetical protein
MSNRKTAALSAVACMTLGALAFAQASKPAAPAAAVSKHVVMAPDQIKWGPGPPSLPPGAQMAVMDGDPSQKGVPFVIRAKMPDGYRVPPHWHPTDENLLILSGTLMVGAGDKIDPATAHSLTAGTYTKMPAKMHHYAMAKGETIFQLHGVGPFEVTYINSADDPRKKAK